jgi:O-acetylserine/cysteine efflux transporter
MRPRDVVLAVLVATIWGVAFVVSKVGLETFTPPQLTALRFLVAATAVIFLPRPKIPWPWLVGVGLTTFTGQFLLQFFGIANGMPAGLTAVVVQTQALFTVVFAALVIADRPNTQQMVGMAAALTGLLIIGLTLGGNITVIGFMLTLGSAVSWAVGNVLVKRMPKVEMFQLMVWASLVPPLPALAVSSYLDGPASLLNALAGSSWLAIGTPLYLGLLASVFAYGVWGRLLQQYPAGAVAPFALLSPCVGAFASALVFGERFGSVRLLGMAAILFGVAIVALPLDRLAVLRGARTAHATKSAATCCKAA